MTLRGFVFILFLVLNRSLAAQTVHGSWYGRADVLVSGSNSNYLTEFILKQKGNEVEGIFGYYFKDVYQSFFVRGTYDKRTRQVVIRNLPLLFYASPTRSGIECPMHFQGTLMVSKVKSTLNGTFFTDAKYRYTCPEMTVNLTMDVAENVDSSLLNTAVAKKFWQPSPDDFIVEASATTLDTSAKDIVSSKAQTEPISADPLQDEFEKRGNYFEKDIIVYDDSILVSFYDNGDIDDDTISVFLNKKPILVKRGLTSRALNIYIGLDSTREVHELSMFADNLGKFPPNTALMVISDRQRRYEFYLSASLKQNASVRLRRSSRR